VSAVSNGLFITGTDTDVGKTVAAAAILALLRGRGTDAAPMKPVQTGGVLSEGQWRSPDLDFCLRMAGLQPDPETYQHMAPYVFEPACSPHLAAAGSGRRISIESIAEAFDHVRAGHECVVVEGAGGIMVPMDEHTTMLDLMAKLGLPVVLVARPALGTLNHTLLSLRELRRAELPVLGVVFCETQPTTWGEIERDNWRTIERLGETRILGRIPYLDALAQGLLSPETFRHEATKELDLP